MRLLQGALVAVIACGGSGGNAGGPAGSATFSGSIHGAPFVPRDAISANVSGLAGQSGAVVLSSTPGLCSQLTGGKAPKDTQLLIVTALKQQPDHTTAAPTSPGTYTVFALDSAAFAVFVSLDTSCQDRGPSADAFGSSGSVTFTSVGDRYAGSFDLTFDATDHGTGTFDAPGCPVLAKLVQDRSSLSCP